MGTVALTEIILHRDMPWGATNKYIALGSSLVNVGTRTGPREQKPKNQNSRPGDQDQALPGPKRDRQSLTTQRIGTPFATLLANDSGKVPFKFGLSNTNGSPTASRKPNLRLSVT